MKERIKSSVAQAVAEATGLELELASKAIETPKNPQMGDLALPCFELAKRVGIAPPKFADELSKKLSHISGISQIKAVGPFLNFFFDRAPLAQHILDSLPASATTSLAENKTDLPATIIEYSSPNIAKPFHVGHLRATLVGGCLDKVYRFAGQNVVSINHLGDWGTQFGFVWAGCSIWGKPDSPTVKQLVELYKKATGIKQRQEAATPDEEAKSYPDVNAAARAYFIDLEKGERYAVDFWQWCLDISLAYFKTTYHRLNISFDHYTGESFYFEMLDGVRNRLELAGILQSSQNALGVELGEPLGFARVFTPDGRSLYLTRDIAAAEYRKQTFRFGKAVYVVGAPQTLHFQQLKGVLKALGHEWEEQMVHVPFGTVLGMKTRGEGEIVELNDLLDEAFEEALTSYREQVQKRPEGLDEKAVAEAVALAALVFGMVSRNRLKDVQFSWKHALEFQGDTGPYLLYAYARINGIRDRALAAGITPAPTLTVSFLLDDNSYSLVSVLGKFTETIQHTIEENEPSYLAGYALELAKSFSKAYLELKVLGEEPALASNRLGLFLATQEVLGVCIDLLGMSRLERM